MSDDTDTAPATPGRRRNVLLIVTDQQRADHAGFGGNPVVQTPNLDRLAATGMRFDRAYVSNPVCMPNRSTIVTGRVPSAHGTRFNGIPLDWWANTFVRQLRDGGYWTALVGKSHLQNIGDHPAIARAAFDGDRGPGLLTPYPEAWDRWENEERHRVERVEVPDFYGFAHVEFAVNHADYASGHYYQWLLDQGVDPTQWQGVDNSPDVSPLWWQVYRPRLPEELYPTTWIADRTAALVRERAASPDPWFIQMSFPDPHHPFTPPGRYWDMYDPADVEVPATFTRDPADLPPHMRRWRAKPGTQQGRMSPFAPTEEQFRLSAAKEYGAITMIDDAIGRVLGELASTGQADDTIVVFTSDHGDMFGDQGIMLKFAMHFAPAVRVPFVWSGPGIAAGSSERLAGSIDIATTVLALAGLPGYDGLQGADLTPILTGDDTAVKDSCLIEEDQFFDLATPGLGTRVRTVITDEHRLTMYRGVPTGDLYDLREDPHESVNLWSDPSRAALRDEMAQRLVETMMAHADESRRPFAMA